MISHDAAATSTPNGRRAARLVIWLVAAAALSCIGAQRSPDILVMASGADLESGNPLVTVHPLSRQVQRYALFVTLARYDSLLVPQPYLARGWAWSNAGRSLTLRLVPDLHWHDGRPTTARDAAFTLLAAKDPRTGYPRASELASLDSAEAVDDTTLLLTFATPQPRLPAFVAELPLVPAHLLSHLARKDLRTAPYNDAPVGNGPFRFVSRERGARWTFARNEAFPRSLGGPAALAGFVIAVVDEATTKFAGLASGELDVAGISPTMANLVARDRTLQLVTYPVLFGTALCFNTTRPPFDDARVRRAIALSLQRKRIVSIALAGYGAPASSPVPPDSPLAWLPPVTHDTALADRLLDAAGWTRGADGWRTRAGRRFAVDLLTVGTGDNIAEQLIQADLADMGISLTVRQIEMGAFLTAARAGRKTFDLLITGVPGDLSFSYVNAMFQGEQRGGALDYTGYHRASLDTLLSRAAAAPDGPRRVGAWRDVQVALDSVAPATWLYHSRGVQGLSSRVHGVRMDVRGELVTVHDWRLSAPGRRE